MTAPKRVSKPASLTYYNFIGVVKHEEVIKQYLKHVKKQVKTKTDFKCKPCYWCMKESSSSPHPSCTSGQWVPTFLACDPFKQSNVFLLDLL